MRIVFQEKTSKISNYYYYYYYADICNRYIICIYIYNIIVYATSNNIIMI